MLVSSFQFQTEDPEEGMEGDKEQDHGDDVKEDT